MPNIVEEVWYDGAEQRIERLGLTPLIHERKGRSRGLSCGSKNPKTRTGVPLFAGGLMPNFEKLGGWSKKVSGDIDWLNCHKTNGTRVCIGLEVQVSARSDLLVVDMIHLTAAFREGRIDAGVIVVPSDKLSRFLTDRAPSISDAKRHANAREAGGFAAGPLCYRT